MYTFPGCFSTKARWSKEPLDNSRCSQGWADKEVHAGDWWAEYPDGSAEKRAWSKGEETQEQPTIWQLTCFFKNYELFVTFVGAKLKMWQSFLTSFKFKFFPRNLSTHECPKESEWRDEGKRIDFLKSGKDNVLMNVGEWKSCSILPVLNV